MRRAHGMDLTGVVSTLESHWVVLDAELSEMMRQMERFFGQGLSGHLRGGMPPPPSWDTPRPHAPPPPWSEPRQPPGPPMRVDEV